MPSTFTHFRNHHLVEQRTLPRDPLLQQLKEAGLFKMDADRNLIHLPTDPRFAAKLGITPHSGMHIAENQLGIISELRSYRLTADYQRFLQGDMDAASRLAARVERFQDVMRFGLANGDLHLNASVGMTANDIRAGTRQFYAHGSAYSQQHAGPINAIGTLQPEERGWRAIAHAETRITSTLQEMSQSSVNLIGGGDEPGARQGLVKAITQAHAGGRLALSEPGLSQLEQTFGSEAIRPLRVPHGQRGFATPQLLFGNPSAGQVLRGAGLLASAADTVITVQRAAQLYRQDNPLAAQSELMHFAGRNVGGWAGGGMTAYALGTTSGAGPLVLIAADAYLLAKAGEKAAQWMDNRKIYRQEDTEHVHWSFEGRAWMRQGVVDTMQDGVSNPTPVLIAAGYEKARELNCQATNAAVELALKNAPAAQNPYRLPANATDRPSLDAAAWTRDASDGQWHRLVKTGISGANERGSYVPETASPARAVELDAEAGAVIARNIASGPGAIAARYELAYHRSGWGLHALPMSAAAQRALPDPDALTASDGRLYRRDEAGLWTHEGMAAAGNRLLELETTRAILHPALLEHRQVLAAIQSPSPADEQREQTLYRYRIFGTELEPDWREAIELASQRTRQQAGLVGDSSVQLQPGATGEFLADSPIAHFRWGADGARHSVAVTRTDEIWQALSDVRARLREENPLPHSPELRIDALSPQEWQAHQQALREANRLGISTQAAQQVARFAAANAGTGRVDEASAPQALIDANRLRDPANDAVVIASEPAMLARAAVAMPSAAERAEPIPVFSPRDQAPDVADAAQVPTPDKSLQRQTSARDTRPVAADEPSQSPSDGQSPAASVGPTRPVPPEQVAQAVPVQPLPVAGDVQVEPRPGVQVQDGAIREDASPHSVPHAPAASVASPQERLETQQAIGEPVRAQERVPVEPDVSRAEDVQLERQQRAEQPVAVTDAAPVEQPSTQRGQVPSDPLTPMQPGHPDHALYQQIRDGVAALDASHGRNFDAVSERMSASLLVLAKDNGLTRVDHVVLSGATADKSAGYNLFVVQGELDNPAHLRAAMPTAQAAQTSVDESMEHLDVVTREQQQRVQAQQVEQQMHDEREQQAIQVRAASMG